MKTIKLGQKVKVDILGIEEGKVTAVGTTHSKVTYDTPYGPQVIEVINTAITIINIGTKLVEAIKALWAKIWGK